VKGATGLVNVDVIKAPRAKHKVVFQYVEEDQAQPIVVNEQEVADGDDAVLPSAPQRTGYRFVGWNDTAQRVNVPLTITAQFEPDTYTVAWVNWANDDIMLQNCRYGEALSAPESVETPEGMTFKGWDALVNGNTTVTGNMVINAVFEVDTFKVDFVDEAGKVIESQSVEYGESAVLPTATPKSEGKAFVGWSTSDDTPWWNVKSNITVGALFAYEDTADSPSVVFDEQTSNRMAEERDGNTLYVGPSGATVYLGSATEDADIYYTTDGSEPVVPGAGEQIKDDDDEPGANEGETLLYDPSVGIIVTKPLRLRALAAKRDMNDSCETDVRLDIEATNDIGHAEAAVADALWFDGNPVEPDVDVWFGDQLLEPGVDFTVTYSNNDRAGTAAALIKGKGDYTGHQTLNFEVAEYDPSADIESSTTEDKPSGKDDGSDNQSENKASGLAVGKKQVVSGTTYKATSASAVEYTKAPAKASVTVPATVKVNGKSYKVTSIAAKAFKGNKKLKKVIIGKNVTSVGKSAFQGCTALKSVVIPAKVTKIGKKAFYGCKKLKKVTFKTKKLKSKKVGPKAFKGTHKKATFKCGKKLKAYKKWLPKKGASKKAKIKK